MNIQSVSSNQLNSYYSRTNNTKVESVGARTFSAELKEKAQDVTPTKNGSSAIWGELSSKYDVRNATFDEIEKTSIALYEAGEISFTELSLITAPYAAERHLKENVPHLLSPNFSMYHTAADEYGRRDWIAEFESIASSSFKYGDLIGFQNNTKVYKSLQKLARE